jgi:hypothetical protein
MSPVLDQSEAAKQTDHRATLSILLKTPLDPTKDKDN